KAADLHGQMPLTIRVCGFELYLIQVQIAFASNSVKLSTLGEYRRRKRPVPIGVPVKEHVSGKLALVKTCRSQEFSSLKLALVMDLNFGEGCSLSKAGTSKVSYSTDGATVEFHFTLEVTPAKYRVLIEACPVEICFYGFAEIGAHDGAVAFYRHSNKAANLLSQIPLSIRVCGLELYSIQVQIAFASNSVKLSTLGKYRRRQRRVPISVPVKE